MNIEGSVECSFADSECPTLLHDSESDRLDNLKDFDFMHTRMLKLPEATGSKLILLSRLECVIRKMGLTGREQ
jgi:hypothetical protein